jgi:exopolysaccharide production protein ExoZ
VAQTGKLNSVQALRAFACLAVVAHHVFRATTVSAQPPEGSLFVPPAYIVQFGAAGVDIFFVISGFLMTYISGAYFSGRRSPGDFIAQRIIRIWPPYAIATLAACLIIFFRSNSGHLNEPEVPFDLQPHRLASVLFIPSFNAKGKLQPIIGPGWTLNYEMMFYACFALVVVLGRRFAFAKLAAIICLLFLVGRAVPDAVIRQFLGAPIIFEFLFGAAIGFSQATGRLTVGLPWAWILLSPALLALFYHFGFDGKWRLLAYGVPAVVLVIGFLSLERSVGRWPRSIILLGDASYSIYLIHTLVIYRVTKHVSLVSEHGISRIATLTVSLAAIVTAVVAGLVFYWTIERPVIRRCQRAYETHRRGAGQVVQT